MDELRKRARHSIRFRIRRYSLNMHREEPLGVSTPLIDRLNTSTACVHLSVTDVGAGARHPGGNRALAGTPPPEVKRPVSHSLPSGCHTLALPGVNVMSPADTRIRQGGTRTTWMPRRATRCSAGLERGRVALQREGCENYRPVKPCRPKMGPIAPYALVLIHRARYQRPTGGDG